MLPTRSKNRVVRFDLLGFSDRKTKHVSGTSAEGYENIPQRPLLVFGKELEAPRRAAGGTRILSQLFWTRSFAYSHVRVDRVKGL